MRRFALSAILSALTVSYAPQIAASTGGVARLGSYREPSSGVFATSRAIYSWSTPAILWSVRDTYTRPPTGAPSWRCFLLPIPRNGGNPVEDLVRNSELKNGEVVTYRRVTRRFFVASGFDGNSIFYDRCNFTGHSEKCVHVGSPTEQIRAGTRSFAALAYRCMADEEAQELARDLTSVSTTLYSQIWVKGKAKRQ